MAESRSDAPAVAHLHTSPSAHGHFLLALCSVNPWVCCQPPQGTCPPSRQPPWPCIPPQPIIHMHAVAALSPHSLSPAPHSLSPFPYSLPPTPHSLSHTPYPPSLIHRTARVGRDLKRSLSPTPCYSRCPTIGCTPAIQMGLEHLHRRLFPIFYPPFLILYPLFLISYALFPIPYFLSLSFISYPLTPKPPSLFLIPYPLFPISYPPFTIP